jgi:hypothetical protein
MCSFIAISLQASGRKAYDDRRETGKAGIELSLALALAVEQDAALGVGVMLDPLDTAAARQKFLGGFLSRCCLGRHHALLVDPSVMGAAILRELAAVGRTPCRASEASKKDDNLRIIECI